MARSRNIKPGFFKNYDLADCGPLTQLLFAGLWCLADKEGRLEDKPRLIKAELFPYYDCDVNGELTKLQRLKFIYRYRADGFDVIEVCNFKKHQSPHHTEKESGLPPVSNYEDISYSKIKENHKDGELTVKTPLNNESVTVEIPLIPDSLIPDSLIPDSLIPRSGFPDQQQDQEPCEAQKTHLAAAKPRKPKKETAPSKTAATWAMYSETYRQRYGVDPVRNAKINGQLSQFVARVGEGEAPGVAQFYLYHNDSYYIKKGHSVDCLLRDAESLRTQWATRTQITGIGAKQMERTSHNQNVINQVIRERAERNEQNKQ